MTEKDKLDQEIGYIPDREFFWFLLGILIAFMLQVLYDGFGGVSNPTQRFFVGWGFGIVFLVLIGAFMIYAQKKVRKKRRERINDSSTGDDM